MSHTVSSERTCRLPACLNVCLFNLRVWTLTLSSCRFNILNLGGRWFNLHRRFLNLSICWFNVLNLGGCWFNFRWRKPVLGQVGQPNFDKDFGFLFVGHLSARLSARGDNLCVVSPRWSGDIGRLSVGRWILLTSFCLTPLPRRRRTFAFFTCLLKLQTLSMSLLAWSPLPSLLHFLFTARCTSA